MESLGEDGRNSLVEALERFLERLEEHAVIAEVDSDGRYHLVKQRENPDISQSK